MTSAEVAAASGLLDRGERRAGASANCPSWVSSYCSHARLWKSRCTTDRRPRVHPGHRRRPRRPIAGGRLVPVPELHEEVRRHVQRVARGRGDGGVASRRRQPARRQRAVVVGMENEVGGAWMLRVPREHRLGDGTGFLAKRQRRVAARHGAEQGQRVEDLGLVVVGIVGGDRRHRVGEALGSQRPWPGPHRASTARQKSLFSRRRRLGQPRLRRRTELGQRRTALLGLLEEPEWLAERQRFAPVGQRETGVLGLRRPERRNRVLVAEAVEPGHPAQEVVLGGGRAAVGKATACPDCRCAAPGRPPAPGPHWLTHSGWPTNSATAILPHRTRPSWPRAH